VPSYVPMMNPVILIAGCVLALLAGAGTRSPDDENYYQGQHTGWFTWLWIGVATGAIWLFSQAWILHKSRIEAEQKAAVARGWQAWRSDQGPELREALDTMRQTALLNADGSQFTFDSGSMLAMGQTAFGFGGPFAVLQAAGYAALLAAQAVTAGVRAVDPSRRRAKELAKAEHAEAVARLHVAKVLAFPTALAGVEGLAATYQAEIVQLRFRIGTVSRREQRIRGLSMRHKHAANDKELTYLRQVQEQFEQSQIPISR